MSADRLWPVVNLGGHATVRARIGWKGLQSSEYQDKGYIFLATPNIKGPQIDFRNVNFISERRYTESPELMLQAGDVLLVKDGSTLGISNIIRSLPGPATVNGSIAVIRCSEGLCPAFLHQLTKATAFQKLINDKKSGLGVPHLFQADLRQFEIPLPSVPEQSRIAEILDTLDQAIRKTEQVIAKLQQVKQGLLHDLLTRGIDDNGELRDPERHPEQFKDSPLGRIPRRWEVVQLSQLVSGLDAGVSVNSEDRPRGPGEVGILKTSSICGGRFDPHEHKSVLRTEAGRVSTPVDGDSILVSRMNTPDLVGETAYVRQAHPTLFLPDRLWQLRFRDRTSLSVRWLSFLLGSAPSKAYVKLNATGTSGSMKNLPKVRLMAMALACPPVGEQKQLASILDAEERRIDREQVTAGKLHGLKHGLMDDLLTGRVRVSVPEEAAA